MGTTGVDKQRSNEIVFNLKGYYRKDGVAVRLYIETSLKNNTLNNTVEKLMKAAEFEPGEIEQEFVGWVKEKEFDTAFDMAIPFSLHRPARAV
jgi:hypothetical protein